MPRGRREDAMYQREVVLYTNGRSLRSWRAKRFLRRSGYDFEVLDTRGHPEMLTELLKAVHHELVLPYVCIDHRPLGSFGVLRTLSASGGLARLLRDNL
jgi:glutaredoxin